MPNKNDKNNQNALLEQLAQLRASYLARLPQELADLHTLAQRLSQEATEHSSLTELHQRLHKLAGSGATFGCPSLSATARALEQQVKSWLVSDGSGMDASALHRLETELASLSQSAPGQCNVSMPAPAPDAASSTQSVVIWLIEEDADLRLQLKKQFEAFNYAVRQFEHLAAAEQVARHERPDLLIMNVTFQRRGEQATDVLPHCPALRALACPLLFIAELDDFATRVQAARLNAAGYFIKPLDVPRLVKRISQVVEQQNAQAHRVLIVDDDMDLAEHMRLTLLAAGMEAEVLERRPDIMSKISSFRPELVLMDVHMPDYSGPDLAGVIRQYDSCLNLPIVYLSAETDLSQQIHAISRGSDDFLTKPISDIQLIAAVRARITRARQLEEQISKDSLTGLFKHASIKSEARAAVQRARRTGQPVSLAILDIDHFKSVNDTHGHALGDVVIVAVATLLRQRLRQSDIIGRYGGEEFVAVLPECDRDSARLLMDDIRKHFSTLRFNSQDKAFICTISIGLACTADFPDSDSDQLLVSADKALYDAKHGGRNRVCVAK